MSSALAKSKLKKDKIKCIKIENINLDGVEVDDLTLDNDNFDKFINLKSLLDNVSACQVSDAYNTVYNRNGSIKKLNSVNNLKVYGKITTAETKSDDWGTSTLAIEACKDGDILFIKSSDNENAIWGELASTDAKNHNIKGVAIYGSARDFDALLYFDFPVFSCSNVPNAGKALGLGRINVDISLEETKIRPGDFFFGDENGVVVIPSNLFNAVMIETLNIKIKESQIIADIKKGKSLANITGLSNINN